MLERRGVRVMNLQQLILLALQVSIILTVFDFGLRATAGDASYLARRPSLLARSLVAMFLIMPIIAAVLAKAFDLRPSVEIALVALSISPVPPLLPVKESKAGGHAAYALGLLAIAGLLAIVIVPVGAAWMGRYFGQPFSMPSGAIAGLVLKSVILPLAAGLVLRALAPAWAMRLAKPLGLIAKLLLAVGVVAILFSALPAALRLIGGGTLLAMIAFIGVGLLVGHWLGGPNPDERTVLALSTASRHPAIALAVAKVNFPDEPFLGAAIVLYLLVGAIIGVLYVSRRRRVIPVPSPS
jgi:bile acid:Na+ symporter, BASS family